MNLPNVQVLVCKCRNNKKTFGIRLEETSYKNWEIDWAFEISDSEAKRENYEKTHIIVFDGLFDDRIDCHNFEAARERTRG